MMYRQIWLYNAYKNKMTAEELLDAFIDGSVDAVEHRRSVICMEYF